MLVFFSAVHVTFLHSLQNFSRLAPGLTSSQLASEASPCALPSIPQRLSAAAQRCFLHLSKQACDILCLIQWQTELIEINSTNSPSVLTALKALLAREGTLRERRWDIVFKKLTVYLAG